MLQATGELGWPNYVMARRCFHRQVEEDPVTQDHRSQIVSSEVVEDDETDHRRTHQAAAVAYVIEDVDVHNGP